MPFTLTINLLNSKMHSSILYRLFVILFQSVLKKLQFRFKLQTQTFPSLPHLFSSRLRFPLTQSSGGKWVHRTAKMKSGQIFN